MPNAKPFPLYTDGASIFYTTDGVNFIAVASAALATPSAAGLMSATAIPLGLPTPVAGSGLGFQNYIYGPIIDLTVVGKTTVIPPVAARYIPFVAPLWEIKTTTGASVGPTYSIGADSVNFVNIAASQTTATLASQAAETRASATPVSPVSFVDLTTNGVVVNVTVGATATALTARLILGFALAPV